MQKFFLALLLTLLFVGCSQTKPHLPQQQKQQQKQKPYKNVITKNLFEEYKKWEGVAYKFGGASMNGIDCSALVQRLYRDALGIKIPRSTKEQIKLGKYVARNRLREGDIIFFKTGYKSMHSGIYLQRGNFINASSTHGVTLSNLNNPYWRAHYFQSRRVLHY